MACRKMNEDDAYAQNTETGCNIQLQIYQYEVQHYASVNGFPRRWGTVDDQNLQEKCQTPWVCLIPPRGGNHWQVHYCVTANHLITLTINIKTATTNILKAAIQYQQATIFCHHCAFKLKTVENYYSFSDSKLLQIYRLKTL